MNTKNKQRAKLALAELEKEMEILTKEEAEACKGGGDGTRSNPYTWEEFQKLIQCRCFEGGFVKINGVVVYHSTGESYGKEAYEKRKSEMIDNAYGGIGGANNVMGGFLGKLSKALDYFGMYKDITEWGNYYTGYSELRNYFAKYPNNNLYRIETHYKSNLGRDVKHVHYYDSSGRKIAVETLVK
ncbi:hypothetical protein [Capnocytophaga felis]|uniref:Uncharacterized protein n=1 Tax=Capnocytophaga felis TaxID=2267611 RepID=A0A5M4BC45_9FLAO|nr:hypothetical protein [Capnocytophaga felis]GET47134.1 hypothetical protein RCZ01_24360 [Capnocytophaga felis]GET49643.1 hypothetical protein RCZ02_24740 [Capnocytophaga felis]